MPKRKKGKPSPTPPAEKQIPSRKGHLPGSDNSHERLAWRFTHADHEGRWRFCDLQGDELRDVLQKMSHLESMTVGEVRATRKLFKEYELPGGLIDEAIQRLVDMGRDDMTAIHRLEFTGTQRLYGFLHSNVFHVVWWDPKHEIWPSKKRHT